MKMKIMITGMLPAALLLSASLAFADFYEWKDKDGMVHMTDSMQNVPEDYRDRVKVHKSAAKEQMETQESAPAQPSETEREQMPLDLYGDQPLEWWVNALSKKRGEIDALDSSIASKKQFMGVFESGR
ncbi:MAG: DUF4124 domain-containing protein, partial [Deltaproteobacteria bacterium]